MCIVSGSNPLATRTPTTPIDLTLTSTLTSTLILFLSFNPKFGQEVSQVRQHHQSKLTLTVILNPHLHPSPNPDPNSFFQCNMFSSSTVICLTLNLIPNLLWSRLDHWLPILVTYATRLLAPACSHHTTTRALGHRCTDRCTQEVYGELIYVI